MRMPLIRHLAWFIVLAPTALHAEMVLVGEYPAKIVPEQVAVLNLPERGTVTDYVDDSRRHPKGTVVAVLNKERTAQEREDMEIQLEREHLNTREELRKLEDQRAKVEFYHSLSPQERKYATELVQGEQVVSSAALEDIDARIRLLRREEQTMERRKRQEFERQHENLTLRMPFDGRLQYNVTMPEDGVQPYEYTGGAVQNFATACDDSAFYVCINMARAELTQLPSERFLVKVTLPGGKSLSGRFDHSRVERNSSSDMLVYYFRLPDESREIAYSLLGSNAKAVLLYEAGEGTERISKASLVLAPEAAECESWEALVSRVYPHHEVVIVTDRDIVIRRVD